VWLVLFGVGAVLLDRIRLPTSSLAALPCPPPPELRYALYLMVAALLRLLIRDARVRSLERRTRRAAGSRGPLHLPPPRLLEVGAGVGKGVAEVVLGDLMGATLAAAALLLRFAASRRDDPRTTAKRAAERRRAIARERKHAALCVLGVGVICAVLVWLPLVRPHTAGLVAAVRARLPGF
jgi:hypothetical protein